MMPDMDTTSEAAPAAHDTTDDVRRAALSAREAAAHAGVHERTVRRAIDAGLLQAEQIDGIYHITPAALDTWLSLRQAGRGQKRTPRGSTAPKEPAPHAADIVPAAVFREERERSADLARELRDTAALVGMLRGRLEAVESERDRLLAISAHAQDAPVDAPGAPGRVDPTLRDDSTLQEAYTDPVPAQVQLATGWRRWWRRMTGG